MYIPVSVSLNCYSTPCRMLGPGTGSSARSQTSEAHPLGVPVVQPRSSTSGNPHGFFPVKNRETMGKPSSFPLKIMGNHGKNGKIMGCLEIAVPF